MSEILDILAFGAHPDDVEIGAGGTLIKHRKLGKTTGICDLTYAELSSNGTVELRQREAGKAAGLLGATVRLNLGLPDRGLSLNSDTIRKVAEVIRCYRPGIVLAPYWSDRHPDHEWTSRIVKEAVFSAGIRKFETPGESVEKHDVSALYYYFINDQDSPRFVVDVSALHEEKMKALASYESQFKMTGEHVHKTVLNQGYLETVEARDRLFGKEQGVMYAEGFMSAKPIMLQQLI